jgi:predicted nuclease of predicted toxin-antitoxin system
MKLKLDENLGSRLQQLFQQRGHEVVTVADEQLCSASDETLIQTCQRERRCLVTLDLDFGNPLVFKPSEYCGIAVLRLPPKSSHADLMAAVETLLGGLAKSEISGRLWLVQPGRIREYQEPGQD